MLYNFPRDRRCWIGLSTSHFAASGLGLGLPISNISFEVCGLSAMMFLQGWV